MLTLLFDGIAYGMLLFVLALGLAVTMGLMNFINLAHGAFAMAGGYILIVLMQRAGWPFLACLPAAFVRHRRGRRAARAHAVPADVRQAAPRPGAVLDRPDLHGGGRRSTTSIGLVAADRAAARLAAHALRVRPAVRWQLGMGAYRLFIVAICVALALGLQAMLTRTRFGSRLRAAVDDPRVAAGLGIPVNRVFLLTFAVGSGLAGLGGALGADMLGLDPTFPLKYMVYFLIVCAVGGTSSITGPLVAALVLGIADVIGKYYVPKLGAFVVYVLMIAILLWRPQGLFTREARR